MGRAATTVDIPGIFKTGFEAQKIQLKCSICQLFSHVWGIEQSKLFCRVVTFETMPTIRFVREGRDVQCKPGENLRQIALKEGIQLYGLKGTLGNCGGCGQCITCFVSVEGGNERALSPMTEVEKLKLKNRPSNWRLACQCVVQSSLIVLTKPQSPPANTKELIKDALSKDLSR